MDKKQGVVEGEVLRRIQYKNELDAIHQARLNERRKKTREWMRTHPLTVERLKSKLPLEPARRWLLQNGELVDEEGVTHE